MPDRRSYLHLLGLAVAGGLSGCLGARPSGSSPATNERSADPETSTRSPEATPIPPDDPPEPVRCRGDPISVERSLTDQPGYDDGIEYSPSNGTVRFVTVRSGGEPAGYDTWAFEEWGRIRTAEVGQEPVQEAAGDRLGTTEDLSSAIGGPPPNASVSSPAIWLDLVTQLDDEGEVYSSPSASLPELAAAAPAAADVTVSLEDDEYARSVPVFAEAVTIRPA